MKKYQKGFSTIEVMISVLVLGLIAFAGWNVWQSKNNDSVKQSTVKSSSKVTKTVDEYAGWKTYMTKYEKLSFKYPSSWTLDDQSDTNANVSTGDSIILTASNNFDIRLNIGAYPDIDPSGLNLISNIQTTFTNIPALLNLFSDNGDLTHVYMAMLTSNDMRTFNTKNVVIPSNAQSDIGVFDFQITFGLKDNAPANSVLLNDLLVSQNFKDTKLIVQSFSY